jgi:hypothetical protein
MALSRWYASGAGGSVLQISWLARRDQVVEIGGYLGVRLAGERRVQDGPDRVHVVAGIRRVPAPDGCAMQAGEAEVVNLLRVRWIDDHVARREASVDDAGGGQGRIGLMAIAAARLTGSDHPWPAVARSHVVRDPPGNRTGARLGATGSVTRVVRQGPGSTQAHGSLSSLSGQRAGLRSNAPRLSGDDLQCQALTGRDSSTLRSFGLTAAVWAATAGAARSVDRPL